MAHPMNASRFFAKLDTSKDGCWEWPGALHTNGYGAASWYKKHYQAHRLSWIFANGPIPQGMVVCHHCDNKRCVRPDHLFIGTLSDNIIDAVRKRRLGRLSVDDVIGLRESVRRKSARCGVISKFASEHGISYCSAYRAAIGRTYAHVSTGGVM